MSSKKRPTPASAARPSAVPPRNVSGQAKPLDGSSGALSWAFPVLLALLTGLVFAKALSLGFVNFDDDALIYDNPMVKNGNYALAWSAQWGSADYKPITYLIWMVLWKMGGGSPAPFHVLNVLLHVVNALLVFLLVRRVSEKNGLDGEPALWTALGTTLLFALHPFRVESVAWSVELKDVLYGFFYLSGLLFCWNALSGGKNRALWWVLGGLFFPLAVLSKSMGITYPGAVFLLWIAHRGGAAQFSQAFSGFFSRAGGWATAMAGLLILASLAQFVADKELGDPNRWPNALQSMPDLYKSFVVGSFRVLAWPIRLLACWPQSVYYSPKGWLGALGPAVHLMPLLAVGASVGLHRLAQRVPFLGWGFAWMLCCLFPALAAPADPDNFLSDRYTYMASLGLMLPLAAALARQGSLGKTALFVLGLVFAGLTVARLSVWTNGETLFADAVRRSPGVANAWQNRGHALMTRALEMAGPERGTKLQAALADFDKALQLRPDLDITRLNRGNVFFQMGKLDEAKADFDFVISDTVNRSRIIGANLARAYSYRGAVHARRNQMEAALNDLNQAIAIEYYNPDALRNRGSVLLMLGRYEEAVKAYQDLLNFQPTEPFTLYMQAGAYLELGRYSEAMRNLQLARAEVVRDPQKALANGGANLRDIDERIRVVNQRMSGQ
jgi:tetratricopeptide (TPR) repeat protein